ncbi:T/G mismatch-specific endonuclease [Lachnospiraceae bacterium XBB2008]|nr:T/G mismatch-specific endonuclease [Lachnospiraceae bacterium XBB2008]
MFMYEDEKIIAPRFSGEVSEKRHKNMSHIRAKDTSIEVALRKALWAEGYRYRKNYKELPGKPDIVLTKYKIAVFCDSEFFHGKDWNQQKSKIEKGKNADYWVKKIECNMKRDQENDKLLREQGWTVIHFWGKDIVKDIDGCVKVIKEIIFDLQMSESESEYEDLLSEEEYD